MSSTPDRDEWIRKIGREIFCSNCRQLTPTNPIERHEDGVIVPCVHCGHANVVLPLK